MDGKAWWQKQVVSNQFTSGRLQNKVQANKVGLQYYTFMASKPNRCFLIQHLYLLSIRDIFSFQIRGTGVMTYER